MQLHLTDIAIRALKSEGVQADYWDPSTPGFGIRVGSRAKTFIAKRNNRRHSIGRYPDLSLADARSKAKKLLASDEPEPSTLTFADAYELFVEKHCAKVRPRTKRDYEGALTRHFLKPFGPKKLAEISTTRIADIIDGLAETPVEAFHAHAVLRTFFRWAISRRYLTANPLIGLPSPRVGQSRSRVLSDDELKRVWTAAEELGGSFGTIVRLLVLTGQRRGEIAALDHTWIGADTITLPASITKNKREHEFPISHATQALLPAEGKGRVFPARGKPDQPFNGWSKGKAELDEKCGVADWTLHDIRRTVATNLAALGVQLPVIERLLNHISGSFGGIVAVYQRHSFMTEMRVAVALWEKKLQELIAG